MPPRIATLTAVFLSISVSAWAAPVYIGGRTNRSWTSGASVSRVARAPAAAPAPAPEPRLARIVPVGYHTAPAAPPPLFKPAPSIESEALGSFFPSFQSGGGFAPMTLGRSGVTPRADRSD